jgi:hypothetical protein
MLRTNLEVWRATLFVSLGLVAGACGGRAESEVEQAPGEPGLDTPPSDTPPSGTAPSKVEAALPKQLRCTGETASGQDSHLKLCQNGILHRPAPETAEAPSLRAPEDTCQSDADCQPGLLCIASYEVDPLVPDCAGVMSGDTRRYHSYFGCQAVEDECAADSQCAAGHTCATTRGVISDGYRDQPRRCILDAAVCAPQRTGGVPGRPFLVGTAARLAGVRAGSDWCGPALRAPEDLDAPSCELAAAHWQAAALMEHASIAAFARFTLQLLQLGAPPELVLASQDAMRDETEHARHCFALAARYAGASSGPGTLPMTGALDDASLENIVRMTFLEGCLGETVAALCAAEALAAASDSDVRRTLALITRDEQRHAELAWRFLAWALTEDDSGQVATTLRIELTRVTQDLEDDQATTRDPVGDAARQTDSALARHGILSARQHRELARAALLDLVLPCAERLLAFHSRTDGPSAGPVAESVFARGPGHGVLCVLG